MCKGSSAAAARRIWQRSAAAQSFTPLGLKNLIIYSGLRQNLHKN